MPGSEATERAARRTRLRRFRDPAGASGTLRRPAGGFDTALRTARVRGRAPVFAPLPCPCRRRPRLGVLRNYANRPRPRCVRSPPGTSVAAMPQLGIQALGDDMTITTFATTPGGRGPVPRRPRAGPGRRPRQEKAPAAPAGGAVLVLPVLRHAGQLPLPVPGGQPGQPGPAGRRQLPQPGRAQAHPQHLARRCLGVRHELLLPRHPEVGRRSSRPAPPTRRACRPSPITGTPRPTASTAAP